MATPQELQKDPATGKNIERRFVNDHSYEIAYNWPYDYLSFVELIKMDAQILHTGSPTGIMARTSNPADLEANAKTPAGDRKVTQSSLDKFRSKRQMHSVPLRKATKSRSSTNRFKTRRKKVTRKTTATGRRGATTGKGGGGSGRGGGGGGY